MQTTTIFKMDLQVEKYKLIEWLIGLQDMATLERLEELRKQSQITAYEDSLKPMTKEELIARSRASDEDIAAGRVHDFDEVMSEMLG